MKSTSECSNLRNRIQKFSGKGSQPINGPTRKGFSGPGVALDEPGNVFSLCRNDTRDEENLASAGC